MELSDKFDIRAKKELSKDNIYPLIHSSFCKKQSKADGCNKSCKSHDACIKYNMLISSYATVFSENMLQELSDTGDFKLKKELNEYASIFSLSRNKLLEIKNNRS